MFKIEYPRMVRNHSLISQTQSRNTNTEEILKPNEGRIIVLRKTVKKDSIGQEIIYLWIRDVTDFVLHKYQLQK